MAVRQKRERIFMCMHEKRWGLYRICGGGVCGVCVCGGGGGGGVGGGGGEDVINILYPWKSTNEHLISLLCIPYNISIFICF